jgi:hypothetical protein
MAARQVSDSIQLPARQLDWPEGAGTAPKGGVIESRQDAGGELERARPPLFVGPPTVGLLGLRRFE